ncbi:MAG TPA: tetratricopeptide repeat protein [Phycisphaeraceae bacterium]
MKSEQAGQDAALTLEDRRRRISGKHVLLAMLVITLIVPPVTWATLRWMQARAGEPARLSWAQRQQWLSPPVRPTTLEQSGVRKLIKGGQWRNLPFQVSPEEEAVLLELAKLAARGDFTEDDVRQRLQAILDEHPDSFYAAYLLGTWHRLHGQQDQADQLYERAFAAAPVVIQLRYVGANGMPVAGLEVGTVRIEHNRIQNHELDPSLVLRYPALVTDARGRVYLPAYRTVFRAVGLPVPAGYEVTYPSLGWFDVVNRIGTLPPAQVRPLPQADEPAGE